MKYAHFFIVFVLFIFLTATNIHHKLHAQDFTAAKAYQDYLYQLSNYQRADAEYQEARDFYRKNPTLQLRENARKKTLSALKNRDQLMVVYLTALRLKMVETTGFTAEEKAGLYERLDPEITWYQSHINSYQEGDDLSTLFNKSEESKVRYQNSSRPVIYNAMFDITLSQQIGSRNSHQIVYTNLKNIINDRVAQGSLKIDPFNRWLSDTDSVLATLNQNEKLAKNKIPQFYTQNFNLNQTYNAGLVYMFDSERPLVLLNNYLFEILNLLEDNN